jgi:hypothetical protein
VEAVAAEVNRLIGHAGPGAIPGKSRVDPMTLGRAVAILHQRRGRTSQPLAVTARHLAGPFEEASIMTRRTAVAGLAASLLLGPALAQADVVLDWNAIMLTNVSAQNPFAQGRFAAITQLAVFEAVNAITGGYEPYLGTIVAPPGASPEAAAVTAAHGVLLAYFPQNADMLDAARAQSLAAIPDGQAKDDGIAVGEAAAAAMIARRQDDGSGNAQFYEPTSREPGEWQATPSCPPQGGVFLHWREVTPFGIASSDQFRADPPPALASDGYARSYNEVKRVGSQDSTERPPDRADVALFYNAVLAVGVWNSAASQVAAQQQLPLIENARAFALLNMAISDGLVSVMETKYHYTLWRPETAIHAGAMDGNPKTDPDPAFVPFIVTPCFPSYPSAHGSAGYAARAVLEQVYGGGPHSIILTTPALPKIILHYSLFQEITRDIDDARVYGGIHFRFDQQAGAKQGRGVGGYVSEQNLRPLGGYRPHGRR